MHRTVLKEHHDTHLFFSSKDEGHAMSVYVGTVNDATARSQNVPFD